MENVVLKKDYRGLDKGTELAYVAELDSWMHEKSEEEIADTSVRSSRVKVQFSDNFVRGNPDVFDVPGIEDKRIAEAEIKIKQYNEEIAALQQELDMLNKEEEE